MIKGIRPKIGLLAFHWSNSNYGAVLQIYALKKFLEINGYDCVVINLVPKVHLNTIFFKQKILEIISRNPFARFKNSYLIPLTKKYESGDEILKADLTCLHSVVVGSDQVWRPQLPILKYEYYLSFVPKGVAKVSYAASFGLSKWEGNNEEREKIKSLLMDFDSISVREDSGVDICRDVFHVEAIKVLDPTLIAPIEIYNKLLLSKSKFKNRFFSIYILDYNDTYNAIIGKFSTLTGLNPRDLYPNSKLYSKIKKYISVSNWLTSIKYADFIITDSFHCVCFSIIFKKQFFFIENKERGVTRIYNLLESLGIKDRVISHNIPIDESLFSNKIDYQIVYEKLNCMREISIDYIVNSLNKK